MALSTAAFRDQLEQKLHHHLTLSHPIFEALLSPEGNKPLLRKVALQGYQLTKYFLTYVEHLFFHCPLPAHKRALITNCFEEETGRLSRTPAKGKTSRPLPVMHVTCCSAGRTA